ncbi:MAG: DNA mismatch repair endonuclease MutL [Planctomycetota bacterium]
MAIRRLSPLLINQIAAGEVIERPASVVKELLENSLDAGATRLRIDVEQGGTTLIRVADNGRGIAPGDLPLAVAAHATSKLATPDDLDAIATLGFRGEALASIASVSRLTLTSRQADAHEAHTLVAAGDNIQAPRPDAAAPGTTLTVADLFFNTPARRKFLRTPPTEMGHVTDVVTRLLMVRPAVALTLTHNGRTTLDLVAIPDDPPNDPDALHRRLADAQQLDLHDALLPFSHQGLATDDAVRPSVTGLAGLPSLARATAKAVHLFLNGRPIRDRSLLHAVREAYRGLIPPDKHPTAAVCLALDPREVDVNVHPAKAEVRFRSPQAVHKLVLTALRQALLAHDLTPSAQLANHGLPPLQLTPPSPQPTLDLNPSPPSPALPTAQADWERSDRLGEPSATPPSTTHHVAATQAQPASTAAFVDYFRRLDPTQRRVTFDELRAALPAHDSSPPQPDAPPADTSSPPSAPPLPPSAHLQVHNSYVVTQDDQGLLIVDQHALHERVMFEQLTARVLGHDGQAGQPLESQRLLMPEVLDADPSRLAALELLDPLLSRIGVEAEPIGPEAIAVHAFPSFLFTRNVAPAEFLPELLDRGAAGDLDPSTDTALEDALHDVLDMMACKAAVKAGDRLSPTEIDALLDQRDTVERSSNCPHGRPTTLRLSLADLAKQFGRS